MPAFIDPATAPLRLTMLVLVLLVGAVTVRYTARALAGAPYRRRALRFFGLTLAAAVSVIAANDLLLLALGWTATSLALHQLLVLIPGRAAAEVGAHKKFLVSRVADVAIAGALLLVARTLGTTAIPEILARTATMQTLPWTLELAAVLLVIAVALRSAQLPVHGWLLHVMEAPTPVSALLHAGIINLGTFVLILLGGFIGKSAVASTLLVLIGGTTAALAGLVMLTRTDVKGVLAWSTSAQMGFVLLECGLGAYPLALLHLVAHALYKAHAFLDSGRLVRPAPQLARSLGARAWLTGAAAAAILVGGTVRLTWGDALQDPAALVTAWLVVLAFVPFFARHATSRGWSALRGPLALSLGLPLLYAIWHAVMVPLVPATSTAAVPMLTAVLVAVGFTGLALVHGIVLTAPAGAFARWLYPHALQGFHLDDLLTRLTFPLWPPAQLSSRAASLHRERSLRLERAN